MDDMSSEDLAIFLDIHSGWEEGWQDYIAEVPEVRVPDINIPHIGGIEDVDFLLLSLIHI